MAYKQVIRAGVLSVSITMGILSAPAQADDIRAFSLRRADQLLAAGERSQALASLGGITRVAGMVFDAESGDVIVVGKARGDLPPIALDDLVVALRARLSRDEIPMVSIDRTENTDASGLQAVRFMGGIEHTQFGQDFLQSDIMLKRYSLDLLENMGGLDPYLKLFEAATAERLAARGLQVEDIQWLSDADAQAAVDEKLGQQADTSSSTQSRFWFHVRNDESLVVERDGVFVIEQLQLGVKEETQSSAVPAGSTQHRSVGAEFAEQFTREFQRASEKHPVLRRLKTLFDLVAIAEGVRNLGSTRPPLQYLLTQYPVPHVRTPAEYELVERVGVFKTVDGGSTLVQLSGGIALEALMLALEDGDVSALRHAVLASRPSPEHLSWVIPLDGWAMPNDTAEPAPAAADLGAQDIGFAMLAQTFHFDPHRSALQGPVFNGFESIPPLPWLPEASLRFPPRGRIGGEPQGAAANIGGVLLDHVPTVSGDLVKTITTGAGFSLLLDGEAGDALPVDFRQFVTALWCVYYSEESPGISIDPIRWGADQQLVRYVGRVLNTDLGRVMREADYLMKRWAVGTSKPQIAGFLDVDSLAGLRRLAMAEAARRFWFTPEDFRFSARDGAVVFEGGRMVLNTAPVGTTQRLASPADLAFARFFTEHYDVIAERYPIFAQLRNYAKLVALAQYLKDQNVPLQGFLFAHRDKLLTELSTDTVDTLSRGSAYVDQLRIEGGVDMHGRYTLSAAESIKTADIVAPLALAALPVAAGENRAVNGQRYATDLAVREGASPGLELVRYHLPSTHGDFGGGWHLLVPLRAEAIGEPVEPFLNVMIPRQWRIGNPLTGITETLTLDTERYAMDGYRPADLMTSQYIGLFLQGDGRLRLVDKIGNEFQFNAAGTLEEMRLGDDFVVRFERGFEEIDQSGYESYPYRLGPVGNQIVDGFNIRLPRHLRITASDGTEPIDFVYGERNGLLGYVRMDRSPTDDFIAIQSGGRFVWVDATGSENIFDLDYRFVKYKQRLVTALVQGHYVADVERRRAEFIRDGSVHFDYSFDERTFAIRRARLSLPGVAEPVRTINYSLDQRGRLSAAPAGLNAEPPQQLVGATRGNCPASPGDPQNVAASGLSGSPGRPTGWPLC